MISLKFKRMDQILIQRPTSMPIWNKTTRAHRDLRRQGVLRGIFKISQSTKAMVVTLLWKAWNMESSNSNFKMKRSERVRRRQIQKMAVKRLQQTLRMQDPSAKTLFSSWHMNRLSLKWSLVKLLMILAKRWAFHRHIQSCSNQI